MVNTVRPVKKLWRISHPQELIICTATSTKTNTGKYLRPATGIGQVRALGHAVESLSKAYNIKIDNILFSDDQVQKKIEKDIIILGGPKTTSSPNCFWISSGRQKISFIKQKIRSLGKPIRE